MSVEDGFVIVIPARWQSSRLSAKVLAEINGSSMLSHVYRRCRSTKASEVIIAVDHQDVYTEAEALGARVVMTDSSHVSGTERIIEVLDVLDLDHDAVVINVQVSGK